MAQVGRNAGPRHCRCIGWAVSYLKSKMSLETKISHNKHVIAAACIMWGIAQSVFPSKIIGNINDAIDECGLPALATLNIPEGMGSSSCLL